MRRFSFLLPFLLLAAGCGGTSPGAGQQALAAARQQWQASRVTSYRYTLRRIGFFANTDPVVITVNRGVPVNTPEGYDAYDTVEELFGLIEAAYETHADTVTVDYDIAHQGYPLQIAIDQSVQIADEEYTLQVSNFTPLE